MPALPKPKSRLLLLLLALLLAGCAARAPSDALLARLERGVNLSDWFAHRFKPDTGKQRPIQADVELMRSMGLGHVRIPVDPLLFHDPARPSQLNRKLLGELHAGLDMLLDADLAVILAIDPTSEYKAKMAGSENSWQSFLAFTRAFVGALSDYSRHQLVYEPLNEPEIEDGPTWWARQQRLIGEIRSVNKQLTLLAAGHRWSSLPELLELQPLADKNLIYSFHFYDPHNFTHQGAYWGWPMWMQFRRFPYPSSPQAVAPALPLVSSAAREHLEWYGKQAWNRGKLAELLDQAAAWARQHDVRLQCSEFGVYKRVVASKDRERWLRDVRELLEARNIGWTYWDYAGEFALAEGWPGGRQPDPVAARGLGLTIPRRIN